MFASRRIVIVPFTPSMSFVTYTVHCYLDPRWSALQSLSPDTCQRISDYRGLCVVVSSLFFILAQLSAPFFSSFRPGQTCRQLWPLRTRRQTRHTYRMPTNASSVHAPGVPGAPHLCPAPSSHPATATPSGLHPTPSFHHFRSARVYPSPRTVPLKPGQASICGAIV